MGPSVTSVKELRQVVHAVLEENEDVVDGDRGNQVQNKPAKEIPLIIFYLHDINILIYSNL